MTTEFTIIIALPPPIMYCLIALAVSSGIELVGPPTISTSTSERSMFGSSDASSSLTRYESSSSPANVPYPADGPASPCPVRNATVFLSSSSILLAMDASWYSNPSKLVMYGMT